MGIGDFLVKALNKGVEFIDSISGDNTGGCEKGDCLINNGTLYHTCSEFDCPRMKTAPTSSYDDIVDPCLWEYMKRLETIQKAKGFDADKSSDFVYDLAKEHMPKYVIFLDIVGLNFISCGIARDNLLFSLLWDLKDEDISWTRHQLEQLTAGEIGSVELHLQYDFYRNPSLYNRDGIDFDYTVKALELTANEEMLSQYYDMDTVDLNDLYDSDGNIKPAGIGGPEAGQYGDTIWNALESWGEI